jgi:hypothetical protein
MKLASERPTDRHSAIALKRQGSEMSIQLRNYGFVAEDRKAYLLSPPRGMLAYGAMVLFAIALVSVKATTDAANVAEFAPIAVAVTGP